MCDYSAIAAFAAAVVIAAFDNLHTGVSSLIMPPVSIITRLRVSIETKSYQQPRQTER